MKNTESFSKCKNSDYCGGCCYQGIDYELQLKNKYGEVKGLLKAANIDESLLNDIKPCDNRYFYRNKMEYTFGDQVKGGEMHLGLHEKGRFMNIISVDECQIVHTDFNIIISAVLDFAKKEGYIHYNKKTHLGFLRNLVIRRGIRSGELLVNIVTSSETGFNSCSFVDMLLNLPLKNKIAGIMHTINDSVADAVVCDKFELLYGRNYYEETILGLKFKVGMFSFFQTIVEAAERLYADAISLIDNAEGKTVYDLYCGTGTISQAIATKAKKVIGVEIVEEAVATARESAALNGLSNCEFIAEDVNTALSKIAEKPDVIIVDPPRSGIAPKAMDQILSYGVDQIVYISCNPKTMVVNLVSAQNAGYEIKSITPYDNFPFTKHVESVVLITRKEK